MTRIIFGGAEVPSNRTILHSMDVDSISIDYRLLKGRGLPKTKDWKIEGRIPDDVKVYITAGLHDADVSAEEVEQFTEEYLRFLTVNADRIEAASEVDCLATGPRFTVATRPKLVDILGEDKVWPVWHGGVGLDALAQGYPNVAIPGSVIDSDVSLAGRTRALSSLYGTKWHLLAHARPDDLRSLPIETVTTLAWLTPMRRGETVVWDGVKLVRYPQNMKDQARRRLAPVCEKAGLDYQAIVADDNKEVARLAIWSYQRLSEKLSGVQLSPVVVDNSQYQDDPGDAETRGPDVGHSVVPMRKSVAPAQRQKVTLPVLGFEEKTVVDYEDGHQVFRTVAVAKSRSDNVRQCDTCFVAAACPAVSPGSECAFNLPIEVKTKDQLLGLLQAMIEMQAARASFAKFAEDLQGGYPDPNVSSELDRLFKMVKQLKEITEDREFIQITAQRSGGSGVLSRIFGENAGKSMAALPNGGMNEEQTTRVIAQTLEAA